MNKKFFKRIKQYFCFHKVDHIIFHDSYYDMMIDNDDLEDFPTYVIVCYCRKCGKILYKDFPIYEDNQFIYDNCKYLLSDDEEIEKFKRLTGKSLQALSMFKK